MKYIFLTLVFLNIQYHVFSQEETSKSGFKIGISYLSNYVYNGRQDSLKTPYITPTLEYRHSSGFYVSGSLSFLTSQQNSRLDYLNLDLGYDFTVGERWKGGVYVEKSHYNSGSTNISSDIGASAGASVSYDAGWINIAGGTDLLFSSKTDFMSSCALSKELELGEGSGFYCEPSFTANFSTQHFYEGYTSRKLVKNSNRLLPNATSIQAITTVDNPGFKLMDFELSLYTGYEGSQWGFYVNPVLAMPRNPIYTTTTTTIKLANGSSVNQIRNSTPVSEKNLNNLFFAELGFYFNF